MKKLAYLLVSVIASVSMLSMTSCSNDDKDTSLSDIMNATWKAAVTETDSSVVVTNTSKYGKITQSFVYVDGALDHLTGSESIDCGSEAVAILLESLSKENFPEGTGEYSKVDITRSGSVVSVDVVMTKSYGDYTTYSAYTKDDLYTTLKKKADAGELDIKFSSSDSE